MRASQLSCSNSLPADTQARLSLPGLQVAAQTVDTVAQNRAVRNSAKQSKRDPVVHNKALAGMGVVQKCSLGLVEALLGGHHRGFA